MKSFLITAALFLTSLIALAQGSYTSKDNKKNNWESGATTWNKQYTWMDAAPSNTDVAGSYVVNVYGYVTRNGNLSFTGGSTLNVYDTLVIKGNFTVASSVVVHPGGVLIVMGNFTGTSSGSNKLTNNGNVVVTGEFVNNGGPITTNGKLYTYDTTPTFGWGSSIDGVAYNGSNTNTMKGQLKGQGQLQSGNSSLYGFVNSVMGVMPVKLVSFTGSLENNSVSLSWITASEQGFDQFELERAGNDLVFKKIAVIKGSGYNTDDEHQYAYNDSEANGVNYYRLKAVDLDGSFDYSGIVSVEVKNQTNSKSISVFPNPSNGLYINVSANFELSGNTEVTIVNQEGVELQRTQLTERETRIDFTNQLNTGIYFLKYTSTGYSQTVRIFVK